MNLRALGKLPAVPVSGVCFRALELQFLKSPLRTIHTKKYPGRFTPGPLAPDPPELLYLCEHQVLSLMEVEAIYGSLAPGLTIPNPELAWAVINIDVSLRRVADLTDQQTLNLLESSRQELTGHWEAENACRRLAPTQQLGLALAETEFSGFLSPSAKSPHERNLNVFVKRLQPGDYVRFKSALDRRTHELRG